MKIILTPHFKIRRVKLASCDKSLSLAQRQIRTVIAYGQDAFSRTTFEEES